MVVPSSELKLPAPTAAAAAAAAAAMAAALRSEVHFAAFTCHPHHGMCSSDPFLRHHLERLAISQLPFKTLPAVKK
jgi:hypothetical protein